MFSSFFFFFGRYRDTVENVDGKFSHTHHIYLSIYENVYFCHAHLGLVVSLLQAWLRVFVSSYPIQSFNLEIYSGITCWNTLKRLSILYVLRPPS